MDSAGNVYVADAGNSLIRKVASGVVSTLAGSAGTTGAINGVAATATFNGATGVAVDSSGTLFVADYSNFVIRMISSA